MKNNTETTISLNIGDIVRVKRGHPCVIISNVISKDGRTEGIPLTHNSVGANDVKNLPLPKDFFDECDDNGIPYDFQWEDNDNGKVTSMMCKIFEKDVENLKIDSRRIGHMNEKGISFLKKNIDGKVKWDLFITKR